MENKTAPTGNKRQLFAFGSYLRPKILLIAVIVLAIFAVSVAWAGQWYGDYRIAQQAVALPGEATYFADKQKELLTNPPKDSASPKEKLEYYDRLRYAYANLNDYKHAGDTFQKRQTISLEGLTAAEYIWAAEVYHKSGDDTKAIQMLDIAEKMLPATDKPDEGYYKIDFTDKISKLRKEYRQ